ncbi:MAG TPA: DUF4389 domain-containing protein [Gaiellaceae bacterium]|nr:DUF4389 domain-containing protein [Gaiellaceae bacterium]
MDPHPIVLTVDDDLRRNRLTVFFRLLLAIPHFLWLFVWSLVMFFAAILHWFVALVAGRPAGGLHRFMCSYLRYQVHLTAYLTLAGNPYPGFLGEEGEYPVDVELPAEPQRQPRLTILFRLLLAVPALLLSSAFAGTGGAQFQYGRGVNARASGGGTIAFACAFLGWFASLVQGRMPKGLRDAALYGIGYSAQTGAYLLLVTDRYPNSDPTALLGGIERPPVHPVRIVGEPHDLRRSRLTVFFRLLLALPHLVWVSLWGVAVVLVSIPNWFVALFGGRPARPLHRFAARWVRYRLHVGSFLYLVANPFPGFAGAEGSYPLDLELPDERRQDRWRTAFRILLAIPALIVDAALGWALLVASVLTWFYALVRGSAPWGLRNLSAYALRYDAQTYAYLLLVTDAYPHASPLEGAEAELPPDHEPALHPLA